MISLLNVVIGVLCLVIAFLHAIHGPIPLVFAYIAFGCGYFALGAL